MGEILLTTRNTCTLKNVAFLSEQLYFQINIGIDIEAFLISQPLIERWLALIEGG
jgi:hypothetical protein